MKLAVAVLCATVLLPGAPAAAVGAPLYPDMRTVVPQHVQLVNEHQREVIRFSNAIANTGDGPWRMYPQNAGTTDVAIQELLDSSGEVALSQARGSFLFHPEHNHWHLGDIALFEVRAGSPSGPVVGSNSIKVTFCLIDWYKLDDNAPTKERSFFDCTRGYQGVSPGWADQYHQATPGQELDVTGVVPGRYYLVSTANHAGTYLESDLSNNTAWVALDLRRDSKGNPKLAIAGHSGCDGALCGEGAPNR